MKKVPITKEGYEKLKRELEYLKTVTMQENIRDIEAARAHGDLSENAEYTAAKERQAFIHSRIKELESNLSSVEVVDTSNLTCDRVVFGTTVSIEDENTGEVLSYKLVGPFESDISQNKISVTSPIGKALIGKSVGDTVVVNTPGGKKTFHILGIQT